MKNFVLSFALLLTGLGATAQTAFPTPELRDLDQQTVDLADVVKNGKPTVISVWATWCQPCHVELDHMEPYLQRWEDELGVDFLAVSVDQRSMIRRIAPLLKRKGWDFDVAVDPNGMLQRTLGFRAIPQMYIVDGNGNIVKEYSGYSTGQEKEIDRILADLVSK